MRYILSIIMIAVAVIFSSCSSNSTAPATNGVFSGDSEFSFEKLTTTKATIDINGTTQISAVATGKDLVYVWSAREGVVFGEGANISYTICHATTDKITCQITDYRGKIITKDISITIK